MDRRILRGINLANAFGLIRAWFVFHMKHVQFGQLPRLRGRTFVKNSGTFTVGDHFSVTSYPIPVSIVVSHDASLIIGNNVFLNYGVDIGVTKKIYIGNDAKIGPLSNVIDSDYHEIEPGVGIASSSIFIGNNVWVGRQCIILPGVTIGENSVVASGSVVTKDVPPNALFAGVPAKFIRWLNTKEGWTRK